MTRNRTAKNIKDAQSEVIKKFKAERIYSPQVIKIVLARLQYDQKKYPSSNSFNYTNTPTNDIENCTHTLGEKLIKGYEKLSQKIKVEYRDDFFKKNDRCPICGRILEKSSKTGICNADLDHFLPKSIYPQFALFTDNLIPICRDCNSVEKHSKYIELEKLAKILKGRNPKQIKLFQDCHYDFQTNTLSITAEKELIDIYGLEARYQYVAKKLYNNLFNLIKFHHINSPESLENFLESCQNSNMLDMISDFSINNSPKIWKDFIDYILYDYNNLTALWEELKEYNKLQYFI